MLMLAIMTSLSAAVSFFLLYLEVIGKSITDLGFEYPVGEFQVLIFLSKPLLFLIPFIIMTSITGTYILTKAWMKNVAIKIVVEQFGKEKVKQDYKLLSSEGKRVLQIIMNNAGKILQSDLVKETGLAKHKISRILNRFENLGLITRERAGMTNIIQLSFDQNLISDS